MGCSGDGRGDTRRRVIPFRRISLRRIPVLGCSLLNRETGELLEGAVSWEIVR